MIKVILCYNHSAEFDFGQWVSAQSLVMGYGPGRRIWLLLWPTCAVGQCTHLVMGYVQVCRVWNCCGPVRRIMFRRVDSQKNFI